MPTTYSLLCVGLGLVAVGLNACADQPAPLPPAGPAPRATAEVAQPLATVRARIFQALQGREVPLQVLSHPELGPQFTDFVLYTNEQQRIDYHFQQVDDGHGITVAADGPLHLRNEPPLTITPALRRYIALPAPARAADMLLQRGPGPYWPVPEYVDKQGQPLPYTCDHLLHLTALAPGRTELEVITLGSSVHDGTEWRLSSGHDGLGFPWPRRLPRRRDVAPAATDQQQVLARLVQLAGQ